MQVLLLHHQLPPQLDELDEGVPEAREVEELGFSVLAMIMAHGDLGEYATGVLEFLDHFQADGPGDALKRDRVEDTAADQAEVAIDVFELEAKEEFDQVVIDSLTEALASFLAFRNQQKSSAVTEISQPVTKPYSAR